jgi:hydroxymethylglutaryl-CoA lyase
MIPQEAVQIAEVGPRDGLQNLKEFVETEKKISLIRRLGESGLREIEAGSFVHPKAIPQFRDMSDVIKGVLNLEGVKLTALVPNLKGAQNALESGIRTIIVVISVSRSHNLNNVRLTPEESLEELKKIIELESAYPGLEIQLDLATTFGCPFEIKVKEEDVLRFVGGVGEMGIRKINLCDTVGFANPRQVERITHTSMENFPEITFGIHLHNTRGLGLANALAAYESGIRFFDSSIGGLGGCPFAPGASGNVATEDIVFMFNEMGVETGVDIQCLLKASQYLKEILPKVALTSALFNAGLPGQVGLLDKNPGLISDPLMVKSSTSRMTR